MRCTNKISPVPLLSSQLNIHPACAIVMHVVTLDDLRADLPEIYNRFRIAYVDAFGSLARNEQTEESDIDLIVEFMEPRQEAISERFFGFPLKSQVAVPGPTRIRLCR